jgi:hypothetical protein
MPQKLTDEIAEWYRRARECDERAKQALDPTTKKDFLDMEWRWITLAHSYELSERISNLDEIRRRKK